MLSNVTVFDFETSGLDPQNDQVIEIAAIRCVNGEIVSSFSTFVRFDGVLSPKITEVTGITANDLHGGLDEGLALKILRNLMGDSLLVAHNALFDLGFMHFGYKRIGGSPLGNSFLDTMTISRERHPYPHKLIDMCNRYGVSLEGAHRALNDVIGCWELLKLMHAESPVDPFVNCSGYLKKFGPPRWTPSHANVFGTENRYENKSS